jgi:ATP-dependent helicase HrpB
MAGRRSIGDKPGVTDRLPIDDAIAPLLAALRASGRAVLQAPPGAGKTTRVPLAILDAGLTPGRIVMLEPRRLAARAAAHRMAETLGEPVGRTVGYRIRGETKAGRETRIEVVTEGILTRMIQSDPGLSEIGAVIFDEFHERSLNADLGLALALELRAALREDLILLAMSATLDAEPVARLMDAPVITSAGRAFPVATRWRDRPLPKDRTRDATIAGDVAAAVEETDGGVLVFLPGEGEIRRVEAALSGRMPPGTVIRPLYGAMDFAAQAAAIRPDPTARKIVLATSIAETSLTIEDIRVVVDAGLARRARFDPGSGMSRLVTERATRAEADQRRGRAGRVAPGTCYRLWTRGEEGAFAAYPPAEIESADLAGLALELAVWGARDPSALPFLTAPNPGAFAEARALLSDLGALDAGGAVTAHGRAMAALPLHPRLAHMLLRAGAAAAPLAALLSDRDPLPRGTSADLLLRLEALANPRRVPPDRRPALERIRTEAQRLARLAPEAPSLPPAQMAALAYPDRVGLRRPGEAPRWVLSGGKGVAMAPVDPLAGVRLIVVTDTDGHPTEATVRQAIAISESDLRAALGDRIGRVKRCDWSRRDRRVLAREQECLGAVALSDRPWGDVPEEVAARAMFDGVRDLGITLSPAAERLRTRSEMLRAAGHDLPDLSDEGLLASAENWILPHLGRVRTAEDWRALDLLEPLRLHLGWERLRLLDRLAPASFTTPLGRAVPLTYDHGAPGISVRLQEMFGVTVHPIAAGQPVRVTLLSPAGRPVQVTTDLPGFWRTSYADVRKDMRGQYPKHPWPEDPTQAEPTLRAKPRS